MAFKLFSSVKEDVLQKSLGKSVICMYFFGNTIQTADCEHD